jgi:hypothetical protein
MMPAMPDELFAAYVALIRHELRLPRGSDALLELRERLWPDDVSERPPARAPAIRRLRAALARLSDHGSPEASPEQFTDDLRFLRLFDANEPWPPRALDALLSDVHPGGRRRLKLTRVPRKKDAG